MKKFRSFTLLEVMVALALLVLAGGVTGWRIYKGIERKRFHSDLERLSARCFACQRLAINMQADWQGILTREGKTWVFSTLCVDQPTTKKFAPLHLERFDLFFNGEEVGSFSIDFTSTGEILPQGTLFFKRDSGLLQEEWRLPKIFLQDGDRLEKRLGPIHPKETWLYTNIH